MLFRNKNKFRILETYFFDRNGFFDRTSLLIKLKKLTLLNFIFKKFSTCIFLQKNAYIFFFLLLAQRGYEASTLCLQPILSRSTISASPHVRPIALISFSTVLRQLAFGLPLFLFPWGVHLRAHLVILF